VCDGATDTFLSIVGSLSHTKARREIVAEHPRKDLAAMDQLGGEGGLRVTPADSKATCAAWNIA
jgi:hypothetical protein